MNPEECEPIRQEKTWVYPWIGILFGIAVGIFIGHPLSMLVDDFYNYINSGTPLDISGAFSHSFHLHMWPMTLIFAVFGGDSLGFHRLHFTASQRESLTPGRLEPATSETDQVPQYLPDG